MNFRFRYNRILLLVLCGVTFFFVSFNIIIRANIAVNVPLKRIYEAGFDIDNADLCINRRTTPKVFVGVISAPGNHEQRMAIRNSWAYNTSEEVIVAFFIGKSFKEDESRKVLLESTAFSDIIKSNNVDSYQNLTLKTVSLLEWTFKYCRDVKYVLKTDDDTYINTYNLLLFADSKRGYKKTIFGELGYDLGPLWWPPKWYVSSSEYNKSRYPIFAFGYSYLITSDAIPVLFRHSLRSKYFKLEDVFITGIVAELGKISRVPSSLFIRRYYTKQITENGEFNLKKEVKFRVSVSGVTIDELDMLRRFYSFN